MPKVATGAAAPSDVTDDLILDFLGWLAPGPRLYAEVMEAWRTSCPRLTVWEDAVDLGYVVRRREHVGPTFVDITPLGRRRLEEGGRPVPPRDFRRRQQAGGTPTLQARG